MQLEQGASVLRRWRAEWLRDPDNSDDLYTVEVEAADAQEARVKMRGEFQRRGDYFGPWPEIEAFDGFKMEPSVWQLPLVDTAAWVGREPEPQAWILPGWLARGTACIFVGEDGVGKSLLGQQLATAVAAGKPFLGLDPTQVPAVYITCEDGPNVLHMRQRAGNRALGLPIDCAPAMLSSLAGFTNTGFGGFTPDGELELSPMFHAVERLAKERGAGLIVLDNVAHLFTGNENVRQQVALFCSALDRLAIACNAAVVMLAHPNKAGAEYSGSTGWSAHVRQRWFMERPEGLDSDARVLRKSKSNYAQAGTEIAFRWHEWAFVRDDDLPADRAAELREASAAAGDNGVFLECLDARTRDGLVASPNVSPNYAPTQFEPMPAARGIGKARLRQAMERLLAVGEIEVFDHENKGKGRTLKALRRASRTSPNAFPDASRTLPARFPERPRTVTPDDPAHTSPYYVREGGAPDGPAPSTSYDADDIDWGDDAGEPS